MARYTTASLHKLEDGLWNVYFSDAQGIPNPTSHNTRSNHVTIEQALDSLIKWMRPKRSTIFLLTDWGLRTEGIVLKSPSSKVDKEYLRYLLSRRSMVI